MTCMLLHACLRENYACVGRSMESLLILKLSFAMAAFIICFLVLHSLWILPNLRYQKLKKNGFSGPIPSFPLGNLGDIKKFKINVDDDDSSLNTILHDIHYKVFPYFSQWHKSYGKVFMYWLGTEPFLNIADPEFLKEMSAGVMGKSWGKPTVFKNDREAMFGDGLNMVEGEAWVHRRHMINPAFSPSNLKGMASLIVDSTKNMLSRWTSLINSGKLEIDVEAETIMTAGDIIARTNFGMSFEAGKVVFEKLRELQVALFKSNRFVGIPFTRFLMLNQDVEVKKLGKEIDEHLLDIISERKKTYKTEPQRNLLSFLLAENEVDGQNGQRLTTRELVDEWKTFFFGGHETTALALAWTLLLLAMYPNWQDELREEIEQVIGDKEIDATMLSGLKKMGWVMNEVFRLYPPAPNIQRQARRDIQVGNKVIPNGTNIWIDIVAMHHDSDLWGEDVNDFKPERFKDDANGGCYHKMGFVPFGFGGRMCVGRNLTLMEYKIVLSLILPRFAFRPSPNYLHFPTTLLTLRPKQGMPLIVRPI